MRVGVLGLGAMGLPIAGNVSRAGFDVVGFDPSEERRHKAQGEGVELAASPSALVAWATHVLVVLRDAQQVRAAFSGPGRLRSDDRPRVLGLMSTLSPSDLEAMAPELGDAGFTVVDAPILSGNELNARESALDIVLAGPDPAAPQLARVLASCGTATVLGPAPGMAQAAKLTCQIMQAAGVVASIEGLRFAALFGLDEERLVPLLKRGSARSWALDNLERVRHVWAQPGDPFDLIYKDLLAVMAEGLPAKLPLPLTAVVANQFLRPELHQPSRRSR
jgi:3-hydroxyisobutyrate dehydrogenase-like beta-hydroxyacid dehydrogenase